MLLNDLVSCSNIIYSSYSNGNLWTIDSTVYSFLLVFKRFGNQFVFAKAFYWYFFEEWSVVDSVLLAKTKRCCI